ncbi:dihydroxy-acid dehydratase [Aeromicrobium sp. UC242_57]|uniref:dihydroxy-acid dehydratase domain-containing protein n=1 Tax=Aeromicrobium sp. UC242_57 TaxID=3374624 RepID=UPI0037AF02E4
MAAASSEKPVILEVVGPMMTGSWRGERLGACTDCRRLWGNHRGGDLSTDQITEARSELVTTAGTCAVMGTASTMACMTEALGMMLPGGATPPASTGERLRHGAATGRRAVELRPQRQAAARDHDPRGLRQRDQGARRARRLDQRPDPHGRDRPPRRRRRQLDDFDTVAKDVPLLVDLKPSGKLYMEDLHRSGGLPSVLEA